MSRDGIPLVFEGLVRSLFPTYESYSEDHRLKCVYFSVPGKEIEYDKLELLSKVLDTKLINFIGKTIQTGWCETCASEESFVSVECSGVRFTEDDPIPEDPQIVGSLDDDKWDYSSD